MKGKVCDTQHSRLLSVANSPPPSAWWLLPRRYVQETNLFIRFNLFFEKKNWGVAGLPFILLWITFGYYRTIRTSMKFIFDRIPLTWTHTHENPVCYIRSRHVSLLCRRCRRSGHLRIWSNLTNPSFGSFTLLGFHLLPIHWPSRTLYSRRATTA